MKKINSITGHTEYTLLKSTTYVTKVISEEEKNMKFDFNQTTKILTILDKIEGDIKKFYFIL